MDPRTTRTRNLIVGLSLIASLTVCSMAPAQDLFKKDKTKSGLQNAFKPASSNNGSFDYNRDIEAFLKSQEMISEIESLGDGAYTLKYEYEQWTFPVDIQISESGTNIWVTFLLSFLEDDADTNQFAENFVKLLEANGSYGDFFFRYTPGNKQVSLLGAIQVRGGIQKDDLARHFNSLASIADGTAELWDTDTWTDAPMHVGVWQSDNGMQLTLNKGGSFELVTGDSNSNGRYQIASGNITMTESGGEEIEGSITFSDANHFQLNVNGNNLSFERK